MVEPIVIPDGVRAPRSNQTAPNRPLRKSAYPCTLPARITASWQPGEATSGPSVTGTPQMRDTCAGVMPGTTPPTPSSVTRYGADLLTANADAQQTTAVARAAAAATRPRIRR